MATPPRRNQQRIDAIFTEIPRAREQLLVAMEDFGADFKEDLFVAAGQSADARQRNRVALVERAYEVLLNWLHELAKRGIAEARRLGLADRSRDSPWEQLSQLGVISHISAGRLNEAWEMRNTLGHAYPPANWRALHDGVLVLVAELDPYVVNFERWARAEEILTPL